MDHPKVQELDEVVWRVHLAAREPGRAALVALLVPSVSAWAAQSFASPAAGLLTALLLLSAVAEFLFPVTYRLDDRAAEARGFLYWRKLEWPEVRRVYSGEREIKLSPLKFGGPREAFRGVLLRLDGNREEVLAAVARYRHAAAGS